MTEQSSVVTDANERMERLTRDVKLLTEAAKRQQFDHLAQALHASAISKGFWEEPYTMDKYVAKLCLVHSEVTEVMEALRKSQGKDKVTEEMADIIIRLLDLYAALVANNEADPELYGVVLDKMKKNAERPPKHGNRWG